MKTMTEEIRKKQQQIQEIRSYACMGCDGYIRHFTGLVYTDHIQQIAEIAGAYWLIDAIGSYLHQFKQPFQVWELKVNEDNTAVLTMKEDTNPIFPLMKLNCMSNWEVWIVSILIISCSCPNQDNRS
jgi:hypothetical protein